VLDLVFSTIGLAFFLAFESAEIIHDIIIYNIFLVCVGALELSRPQGFPTLRLLFLVSLRGSSLYRVEPELAELICVPPSVIIKSKAQWLKVILHPAMSSAKAVTERLELTACKPRQDFQFPG
jgi:hypothetical protein